MQHIRKIIDHFITSILIIQGIALVAIICLAVFFRYVVGAALSWPEEVAGILFVWYTLLGIVFLVSSNSHIAFDILEKKAPPLIGIIINILSHLIIMAYAAVMVYYGWKYLKAFPYETSAAAGINLTWLKSAIPISGGLIISYILLNQIKEFFRFIKNKTKGVS
ncbi:MAG: hypothetical protein CSA26_06205 [Desulfobacterales bacterium]|nr:MAG: hypothetical protein CSA26_06205 [Desulfobacterales bacterium]